MIELIIANERLNMWTAIYLQDPGKRHVLEQREFRTPPKQKTGSHGKRGSRFPFPTALGFPF